RFQLPEMLLVINRFFFSSRRRHTRFSRDWSSDVCSSDLLAGQRAWITGLRHEQSSARAEVPLIDAADAEGRAKINPLADWTWGRSEERRVGKEGRARWFRYAEG